MRREDTEFGEERRVVGEREAGKWECEDGGDD